MKSDRERLMDIREAIERIQRYADKGREGFGSDELLQTWVVYHLQIIGEAVGRLSDQIKDQHPEIPWREIVAMRNILVHDYFAVDADEVWNVVEGDLPTLKASIDSIQEATP
ncbi:MAG: DUF86 domain-containing protein [Actinobacteria bacterium]|nr:DUF86 domain-containing protein [Actinomycetota bacterium]MBU1943294.1 DUF86 domain-containing protein [Actinomycetota bacterium]MBU2686588.1 DUF86 domain-containing protein [Actinomycetota bacterium]